MSKLGYEERAKMNCAVYLVLERDGMVLLQERKNSGFYDGYYGLPSGHWEYGETVVEAMIREAKEETTIDILPEDLKHVLTAFNHGTNHYVGTYFFVNKFTGVPKIGEPDKCSDLRFFAYDQLPCNIIPYIKEVLMLIKENKNFAEFVGI